MNQSGIRVRITIILYILSITISVFIFSSIMSRKSIDFEYTSYASCAVDGSDIYYAQNTDRGGVILKLDTKSRVSKMFFSREIEQERVLAVSAFHNSIYAVLSNFANEQDENNGDAFITKSFYRIVCLDKDLHIMKASANFALEDGQFFKNLSVEKNGIFLTTLSDDGLNAYVYHIDANQLEEFDEGDDYNPNKVRVEKIRSKKAENNRFYSDACYIDGQLYVRTDADQPVGVFEKDSYIKEVVSEIKPTTAQIFRLYSGYILAYISALIVWYILLYLIIRAVLKRNRTFYFIIVAEAVLFTITLIGSLAVVDNYQKARLVEHSRFAVTSLLGLADAAGLNEVIDYSDRDVYDTERYQEIKDSICEFVKRDGNNSIFYDVFVYSILDGTVCASGSGRNRELLTDIFGQKLSELQNQIFKGEPYVASDFVIEGEEYRAIAIEVSENAPKFALVGIINATTLDRSVVINNSGTFLLFITVFAIGSVLVVLVWRLYLKDITALENALAVAASGGKFPERPDKVGSDVKEMWDSVSEINKKLEENEYIKIRILEAYYRFAPKNVERALFKNSILEVKNGNSSTIRGTVAIMGIDIGGDQSARIDTVLECIGEYQKEHDCMIVGKSPDLSLLQMFFMETDNGIVKFLIDLYIQNVKSVNSAMISTVLYFDSCRFSVMGSAEEATTCLYSGSQELLKGMVSFVSKCKLGLVIAENVKNRENLKIPYRFIGSARRDSDGVSVKLYEVLDVYPANIRAQRLSTLTRFNEALNCFYEKDFYIARTKFSEILKEAPNDELVRWYVFESERYLNEVAEGEKYKFLHL